MPVIEMAAGDTTVGSTPQWMEPVAGMVQLGWRRGGVKRRKNTRQPGGVRRLNAAHRTSAVEGFESLMPEADDHKSSVARGDTNIKRCTAKASYCWLIIQVSSTRFLGYMQKEVD